MSIISLDFFSAVFLALILYYISPPKMQWLLLLILSLGFVYLNGSIAMLLIFASIVFIPYTGALMISRATEKNKRIICSATVICLVSLLFISKDLEFLNLLEYIFKILIGGEYTKTAYPVLQLIGISYFILSLIGYVLDVYWGKYLPEKNYFKVLLFAGYFPQLTSGPITRFSEMSGQLFSAHTFDVNSFIFGAERAMWGCFKKMVLADRAAIFVNGVFEGTETSGILWLVGTLIYAFQLYMDFSGCMDIVLGVSECFQIILPENFTTPFASETLGEFWRRWHITMGVWFKEYLLYPILKTDRFQQINQFMRKKLGKKYGKKAATCLGLSVLWFVIGVWHGGSAVFILASGIIPGFFLVLEELLEGPIKELLIKAHINTGCFSWRLFKRLRVLLTMCCSWIFVRAGSVYSGFQHLASLVSNHNPWILHDGTLLQSIDIYDWIILGIGLLAVTIVGVLHEQGIHLRQEFQKQNMLFRWMVLMTTLLMIFIFGIYGPGYNAASFIYKGF